MLAIMISAFAGDIAALTLAGISLLRKGDIRSLRSQAKDIFYLYLYPLPTAGGYHLSSKRRDITTSECEVISPDEVGYLILARCGFTPFRRRREQRGIVCRKRRERGFLKKVYTRENPHSRPEGRQSSSLLRKGVSLVILSVVEGSHP